jgi:hypothetical protein
MARPIETICCWPHRRQHREHPFDALGILRRRHAGRPHAEREVLLHGQPRKNAAPLRHHGDAVRREHARHVRVKPRAVHQHTACFGRNKPEQRAHQGALAGAVVTDHAQHFGRPQLDCDVEQHRLAAVTGA